MRPMTPATRPQLSRDPSPLPRKYEAFWPKYRSVGRSASADEYVVRYQAPTTLCWLTATGITPVMVTPSAKTTGRLLIRKLELPGQSRTKKPADNKNDGRRIIVANPSDMPASNPHSNERPSRSAVLKRNAMRLNTLVKRIGTSPAFIEKLNAPSRAITISPTVSANTTNPIVAHARFQAAIANAAKPEIVNTHTTS